MRICILLISTWFIWNAKTAKSGPRSFFLRHSRTQVAWYSKESDRCLLELSNNGNANLLQSSVEWRCWMWCWMPYLVRLSHCGPTPDFVVALIILLMQSLDSCIMKYSCVIKLTAGMIGSVQLPIPESIPAFRYGRYWNCLFLFAACACGWRFMSFNTCLLVSENISSPQQET